MFILYTHSTYTNIRLKYWSDISLKKFLKSFFQEWFFHNLRFAIIITRFFPKPKQKPTDTIFIFIYGYLGHLSDWRYFLSKLRKTSSCTCYTLSHHSTGSIATLSENIAQKIKELDLENKEIILFGHSMGGLIASYITENYQFPIKKVYALGSPFLGTPIAKIGIGASCKDMSPGSLFTKQLLEQIKKAPPSRYYFLWSILDNTVYPAPRGHSFGKQQVTFVDHLGHISILFSKDIFNLISTDLKGMNLDK